MVNHDTNTQKILYSCLTLTLITIALFSASEWYTQKDKQYFQDHKDELTRIDRVTYQDGTGENYYYDSTPYTAIAKFLFNAYVLIPPLICILLGTFLSSKNKKILPGFVLATFFTLLTFLLQSRNIYHAVGWEKPFGILLISIYCAIVIFLSLITSFILTKIKKSNS